MPYSNIILITVDCFRYDRCGFSGYSHSTTPFLDTISSESIVFESAYATGPYTPESFPGMLAGLHSNSTPYVGDLICKAIPSDAPTIADRLKDTGFTTLATVTNPHLSEDRNFDLGFEHFQNLRLKDSTSMVERRTDSDDEKFINKIEDFFKYQLSNQSYYPNPFILPYIAYRYRQLENWPTIDGADVREQLIAQLNKYANTESSTFAWCHFNDAHAPIHPQKEPKVHDVGGVFRQLAADSARISGIEHERTSKRYDNALRYIDSQIKYLFDDLSDIGLLDDTAVIILGDHGEGLGERGVYNHPWHYMYDILLHVPLLIWTSDRDSEKRLSSPYSLAWLHRIVSRLSGAELGTFPTAYSGNPFEEGYYGTVVSDSVSPYGYSIAVRDQDKKCLDYRISEVPYHTHRDVFNQNRVCLDLSEASNEDSAEKCSIEKDMIDLIDSYHISPKEIPEMSGEITNEAEHRLKQLGYLES